jgi:hypothetical protein
MLGPPRLPGRRTHPVISVDPIVIMVILKVIQVVVFVVLILADQKLQIHVLNLSPQYFQWILRPTLVHTHVAF